MDLLQNPFTFFLANATMIAISLAIIMQYIVKPARWVESVKKDLETLKDLAKATDREIKDLDTETNKNFDEIRGDIKKILIRLPADAFAKDSPISLTEIGEKIFVKVGGKEWATQLAAAVQNAVAGMQPYGIQEYCFDYVCRTLKPTAEQQEKIDAAAFENGVPSHEVLGVLAIAMRDILLERNGYPVPKRKPKSEPK